MSYNFVSKKIDNLASIGMTNFPEIAWKNQQKGYAVQTACAGYAAAPGILLPE